MLRGVNPAQDADINRRHESGDASSSGEPSAKRAM